MRRAKKARIYVLVIVILIAGLTGLALYYQSNRQSQPYISPPVPGLPDRPRHLADFAVTKGQSLQGPLAAIMDRRGWVYVADSGNHRIAVFKPDGTLARTFGHQGDAKGDFNYPAGLALLANGNLVIADTNNYRLQEVTTAGKFVRLIISAQAGIKPGAVAVSGNHILISDWQNHLVQILNSQGKILQQLGGVGEESLQYPQGIAVDRQGRILVADAGSTAIKVFSARGQYLKTVAENLPDRLSMVRGLAVDYQGRIYIADTLAGQIRVFNQEGQEQFRIGQNNQGATLVYPNGLSIGPDNQLLITDRGLNQVQVWGFKK